MLRVAQPAVQGESPERPEKGTIATITGKTAKVAATRARLPAFQRGYELQVPPGCVVVVLVVGRVGCCVALSSIIR